MSSPRRFTLALWSDGTFTLVDPNEMERLAARPAPPKSIEVCPVSELDAALAERDGYRNGQARVQRDLDLAMDDHAMLMGKVAALRAELAEERAAADRLAEALVALNKACDLEPDCAVCGSSGHEELCPRRVMVPEALAAHDARRQPATEGGENA